MFMDIIIMSIKRHYYNDTIFSQLIYEVSVQFSSVAQSCLKPNQM